MTRNEDKLVAKQVKPTANRLQVYAVLQNATCPMSLNDMEAALPTIDKSNILRVLHLFQQHHLVHSFEDGRGIAQYEICRSCGDCDHHDAHLHFYCTQCQRTYCLQPIDIALIDLPKDFVPQDYSFVVKGTCPHCR